MKKYLLQLLFGLAMFGLGILVTFGIMSQQNIPTAQISLPQTAAITTQTTNTSQIPVSTPTANLSPTKLVAQANSTKVFNTQQFSQEQLKQIVNNLSDTQLNDYLAKFIPIKDSELIADKRQFTNRAIEELYKQNDNQPLQGQILLSNSSQMPSQSIDTSTVNKRQKLFAHLNTYGKVPLGSNVFVKWVNRNTGEVLLFEKKLIQSDSDINWVSFQPYDSWQVGSYDIRFYQFNSQLEPVAQLSYDIRQVID